MDKHDTIGIDCVAMCVNDIVCSGAEPLFFLTMFHWENRPEQVAEIVKGISNGCVEAGCALIGGETAEMPGFYPDGEYDLAGFAVGVVDKGKIIDGKSIKEGDKLIGLASSGIHSNGYSLVRKVLSPTKAKLKEKVKSLGSTLGEALLTPTKIYVKTILDLKINLKLKEYPILQGGFYENLPRMLPEGLGIKVFKGSWPVLPVFNLLQDVGMIDEDDMFNTFNMGIGMVIAVDNEIADGIVEYLNKEKEEAYIIGEVVSGKPGLRYAKNRSVVSGGGTNLQALIDKIEEGYIEDCSIVTVVSSKEGVYAQKEQRNMEF